MEKYSLDKIRGLHARCDRELRELEYWPGYYDRRLSEFMTYLPFFPEPPLGKVLEVGCGNGFYSALLSLFAQEVVATDLASPGIPIHAQALGRARRMMEVLGIPNVRVEPASVEELPFADGSFDLVLSSHVLAYPKRPDLAVSEINRVLRPGGLHVCIVPGQAAAVHRLVFFQWFVLRRIAHHLVAAPARKTLGRLGRRAGAAEAPRAATTAAESGAGRVEALRHFPFPRTFGGLPHWFDELRQWSPKGWRELVTAGGRYEVVSQATTQLNPLLPWLGELKPRWMGREHERTRAWELRHGSRGWLQRFGANAIIVTRKP